MPAAPQSTGMEKGDYRKMLTATKEKPAHCAIGVGKDQTVGLLILDKMKAGKMLEKKLIDDLEAKNTRWGTAQVDWENDHKLVKLFLNKPISGMAKRLVKTIKGTGFSKVQIVLEDGTPVENAAGEEDEEGLEAGAEAEAAPAAAAPTGTDAGTVPPPPPPPPQAEAPAQDAAELTRRLAALAPRIPQVAGDNAERKAELLKLASLGNVNIKTNNLTYAATYIAQLEKALAAPPPPPPPPSQQDAGPAKDAGAMARELAALIPRVAQLTDATQKAELGKLATQVNVNIKTNNLTYAATYLAQLKTGLDRAAAGGGGAADAGAFAQQGQQWAQARSTVEAELGKLRSAILAAYQDQPYLGEIASKFNERTAPVLSKLDLGFTEKLAQVSKAADAAERTKLLGEARGLLDGYRAYAKDPLLTDLDDNPFVKLSIQATVTQAADGLAKALA